MIHATVFAAAAQELVGVPWQHRGRNVFGVDCLGVVMLGCEKAQIRMPEVRQGYGLTPGPELLEGMQAFCIRAGRPRLGGLALFQFDGHPWPRHVAVISGSGIVGPVRIVHCNAVLGRVVEHGLRAQWSRWLHSMWLLPGVDYS